MATYIIKIPDTVSVVRLEKAIAKLSGVVPHTIETCERCKGSGMNENFGKIEAAWGPGCYTCHGRGFNWIDFDITPYPTTGMPASGERAGAEPLAERSSGSS